MRTAASVLTPLLFVFMASAQVAPTNKPDETADEQSGYCPRTHNLEAKPSAKYWLEGVIGSRTVKMFLERGGSGGVGLFYEPDSDWTPVFLGGKWEGGGLDVSAWSGSKTLDPETDAPFGCLQLRSEGNLFLGEWTLKGSDHAEPVRLSAVPKNGCAGKEAWTRFDNPKWPFSFSYPSSWKPLEETEGGENHIRLVCPDPEEMAYDTDITVSEGLGDAAKPSRLVRCGNEWRYDADCGDDLKNSAFSHIPVQSVRHGMKILDISDREWRLYCRDGGYVGQSDGTDLIVLLKNGWVEISGENQPSDIVGRIVDTIQTHTAK